MIVSSKEILGQVGKRMETFAAQNQLIWSCHKIALIFLKRFFDGHFCDELTLKQGELWIQVFWGRWTNLFVNVTLCILCTSEKLRVSSLPSTSEIVALRQVDACAKPDTWSWSGARNAGAKLGLFFFCTGYIRVIIIIVLFIYLFIYFFFFDPFRWSTVTQGKG